MKSKGVFWGVLLVAVGLLFVLRNLGYFYFSWHSFWRLWPVILVVLGISLLPVKGFIRIIIAFVVIAVAVIFLTDEKRDSSHDNWDNDWGWNWNHKHWNDDNESDDETWNNQVLTEDYTENIQNAVLDLDAVAGTFQVRPTDENLIKFEREGNVGKYTLDAENAGNSVVLKLTMNGQKIRSGNVKNDATISLNPKVLWDFKVDAGAAKIDFDLSPFKIDRIDVDGGASDLRLKLGDLHQKTDVSVSTGASSITILVPQSAGCELRTSTVLTSKSFDGFEKIDNGYYQTQGYSTATKKISIKIDAAVSSLRVERY